MDNGQSALVDLDAETKEAEPVTGDGVQSDKDTVETPHRIILRYPVNTPKELADYFPKSKVSKFIDHHCLIGRNEGSDILLNDSHMSRKFAILRCEDNGSGKVTFWIENVSKKRIKVLHTTQSTSCVMPNSQIELTHGTTLEFESLQFFVEIELNDYSAKTYELVVKGTEEHARGKRQHVLAGSSGIPPVLSNHVQGTNQLTANISNNVTYCTHPGQGCAAGFPSSYSHLGQGYAQGCPTPHTHSGQGYVQGCPTPHTHTGQGYAHGGLIPVAYVPAYPQGTPTAGGGCTGHSLPQVHVFHVQQSQQPQSVPHLQQIYPPDLPSPLPPYHCCGGVVANPCGTDSNPKFHPNPANHSFRFQPDLPRAPPADQLSSGSGFPAMRVQHKADNYVTTHPIKETSLEVREGQKAYVTPVQASSSSGDMKIPKEHDDEK